MNNNSQNRLIQMLADSQIYKDYERAFGETTGLPLNLSPVEYWQLAHHGRNHENPVLRDDGSIQQGVRRLSESTAADLRHQRHASPAR